MKLSKEDPVYYKDAIAKLIKAARKEGLIVYMSEGDKCICFKNAYSGEIATSYIPWLFKE